MRRARARGVQHALMVSLLLIALAVPAAVPAQDDRLRTYRGAVEMYRGGRVDEALRIAESWRPGAVNGDVSRIIKDRDARLAPGVALLMTELAWRDSGATDEHFGVAEALVNNLQTLSPEVKEFRERWYAFMVSVLVAEVTPSPARTLIERGLRLVGDSSRLQLLSGIVFEMSTYPHATCGPSGCGSNSLARDLTLAANAYRQVIAIAPQSFDAHLRLGRVLHLLGDRDGARRAFDEVERTTGRADLRYLVALFRADLHREEGDLRRAAEQAERAVSLGPGYQSARIALAHLSDQLGMADRSRQIVVQLLQLPKIGDPWWEFRQPAQDTDSLEWMRASIRR